MSGIAIKSKVNWAIGTNSGEIFEEYLIEAAYWRAEVRA